MTAEQVESEINRGMYYVSTSSVSQETVVKVLDALVADGAVRSGLVSVSAGNKIYVVRVFNSINWPIPGI